MNCQQKELPKCIPPFLQLPPEILLKIIALLDVPDILSLRITSRILSKATYERTIWIDRLQRQAGYLPLSSDLLQTLQEDQYLSSYPTSVIESTVVKTHWIEGIWPEPRKRVVERLKNKLGNTLMGLRIFLERWLVAIYYEGAVLVYDIRQRHSTLYASLDAGPTSWSSHGIAIDVDGKVLTVAVTHSLPPHVVELYQLDLAEISAGHQANFKLLRAVHLPSNMVIQALRPAERLVILTMPGIINIMEWDETPSQKLLTLQTEDLEGLWNGVISVTFLGPYILVFKTRSLEIHSSAELGILVKHTFAMTFRVVSFSNGLPTRNKITDKNIYEITFFAYDVIQGLFHYTVRLSAPEGGGKDGLDLDVQLTSIYPLALGVVSSHPRTLPTPSPTSSISNSPSASTLTSPAEPVSMPVTFSAANSRRSPTPVTFTHTHTIPEGLTASLPNSPLRRHNYGPTSDYTSRGFLSAHALGEQGKRGIWVERKRSSIVREVQVWAHEPEWRSDRVYLAGGVEGDGTVEMERRVIYTIHSYDLRDDITCCTLGEICGTIVLGHRSGELSVIRMNNA